MTPDTKTRFKDTAQERLMPLLNLRALEHSDGDSYIVEGYAAKYEKYVYYQDGEDFIIEEQFTRQNFVDADKSDIIFQFDHAGRVFARTSNGTLSVFVDDIGFRVVIDLGKTEAARSIYEDIKAGMITKMSWRFKIFSEDLISTRIQEGDKVTYLWTYKTIRKIYDVSAVSIPANNDTEISARTAVDGLIAAEKARREAEAALNNRINALLKWAES